MRRGDSSELVRNEYEERHTPLNMKPYVLGSFPTWYMQMYHTQHMEHVKLEGDSDLTDMLMRKQTLSKIKCPTTCETSVCGEYVYSMYVKTRGP